MRRPSHRSGSRDADRPVTGPLDFQLKQPYLVRLEGESLTLRDRMVVSQAFLVLIEECLGDPARVIACFRAWSRQMDADSQWMSGSELLDARAWQRAFDHATGAAQAMLSQPGSGSFSFALA